MCRKIIGIILLSSVLFYVGASELGYGSDTKFTAAVGQWPCPAMDRGQMAGAHRGQWLKELKKLSIEGRIEDVNVLEFCMGERRGLHLKVRSGDSVYQVHLGPAEVVDDQKFRFALGDDIRVSGAVYEVDGSKILIAYTVEKGDQKLILRGEDGRPNWTVGRGKGQGRRGRSAPAH